MKKIALVLMVLMTVLSASAQQNMNQQLQMAVATVRSKAQTTQMLAQMAQQTGNASQYQLCEVEAQIHVSFYNYLQQMAQNPQYLNSPKGVQEFNAACTEYAYRTKFRDYRSTEEIVPNLRQWIAQRQWEVSTPEGQQAYYSQQQASQNAFNNHQARMRSESAQFDNYMNSLRAASNQQDKYQHQYVNTIHDQYEYVNPYDGQGYLYPNTNTGYPPTMENPDGSVTELVPYEQW